MVFGEAGGGGARRSNVIHEGIPRWAGGKSYFLVQPRGENEFFPLSWKKGGFGIGFQWENSFQGEGKAWKEKQRGLPLIVCADHRVRGGNKNSLIKKLFL